MNQSKNGYHQHVTTNIGRSSKICNYYGRRITNEAEETTRYCQANLHNEELDDLDEENHSKTKRKDTKVEFDTIKRGVYYQNYYNERHFAKECKRLNKFCQICKSNEHNTYHCLSKIVSERCPSKEIILVHIVQAKVLVIQE